MAMFLTEFDNRLMHPFFLSRCIFADGRRRRLLLAHYVLLLAEAVWSYGESRDRMTELFTHYQQHTAIGYTCTV